MRIWFVTKSIDVFYISNTAQKLKNHKINVFQDIKERSLYTKRTGD